MTDWLYKGKVLEEDDIPDKSLGFVYLITYNETGQRYIGRKLLTKAHRRQKNKKIIRSRVESDWKDYWSSSPFLLELIEEVGTDKFTREILHFVQNRSQLMYLEEKLLYSVGALESEDWINSNIRSKVYKKNIMNKIDSKEIETIINKLKGDS